MNRNSLTDLSARAMHHAVRMGIQGKINDNPMWQELDFGGLIQDGRKFVERVQAFGFSSVPLPPIVKQAMGAAGGGSKSATQFAADGGGGEGGGGGGQPQEAEGIAIFMAGQRNHPVIISVDDRRHRPMGLKPGENAQYDDIQQMTLMRRDGLYLLSNDNPDAEGKTAERMASLRHVEKKQQERKPEEPQATQHRLGRALTKAEMRDALRRKAASDQAKQDHKHEGETVNTEVRVTKKKIEFRDGENVKGFYDKQAQHWNINGKKAELKGSDNTEIGDKNVKITGATGIQLLGPTTINGSPAATMDIVAALEARIFQLEQRIIEMGGG